MFFSPTGYLGNFGRGQQMGGIVQGASDLGRSFYSTVIIGDCFCIKGLKGGGEGTVACNMFTKVFLVCAFALCLAQAHKDNSGGKKI